MKKLIDAVASALIQDQLKFQILGQDARHSTTVLDGNTTTIIETRFQLLNIQTKEISVSEWMGAPTKTMESVSANILNYIKSISSASRTIN